MGSSASIIGVRYLVQLFYGLMYQWEAADNTNGAFPPDVMQETAGTCWEDIGGEAVQNTQLQLAGMSGAVKSMCVA